MLQPIPSPADGNKVRRVQLLCRWSPMSSHVGLLIPHQLPRSDNPRADVEQYITTSALSLILYTPGQQRGLRNMTVKAAKVSIIQDEQAHF